MLPVSCFLLLPVVFNRKNESVYAGIFLIRKNMLARFVIWYPQLWRISSIYAKSRSLEYDNTCSRSPFGSLRLISAMMFMYSILHIALFPLFLLFQISLPVTIVSYITGQSQKDFNRNFESGLSQGYPANTFTLIPNGYQTTAFKRHCSLIPVPGYNVIPDMFRFAYIQTIDFKGLHLVK
jgi:hypothetical protein